MSVSSASNVNASLISALKSLGTSTHGSISKAEFAAALDVATKKINQGSLSSFDQVSGGKDMVNIADLLDALQKLAHKKGHGHHGAVAAVSGASPQANWIAPTNTSSIV